MLDLSVTEARSRWSAAQGLDRPVAETVAATLERTGWVRTLGGIAAYIGLSARNPDATIDAIHAAVQQGEIGVSPAVRGCIFLVPRSHEALCLRVAHHLSAKRIAREHDKLGLDEAELDQLGEAILEVVGRAPHTTAQLRKELPDGAIRSLGEPGKKLGVTSTLPPALRRLEVHGRLRRTPIDGRLDHERYAWAPHALDVGPASDDDLTELASLYLRWAGPSTRKEFAAWSGLNQTQAKRALAACGAEPAALDGDEVFVGPTRASEASSNVHWLPAMDNLYALRASARHLVDPAYAEVEVSNFGSGGRAKLATMSQPIERTLVRDGEVIGLWGWDPTTSEVVTTLSPKAAGAAMADGEARVRSLIETIGHAKVFSIDSDAKLTKRAQRLRDLRWP